MALKEIHVVANNPNYILCLSALLGIWINKCKMDMRQIVLFPPVQ